MLALRFALPVAAVRPAPLAPVCPARADAAHDREQPSLWPPRTTVPMTRRARTSWLSRVVDADASLVEDGDVAAFGRGWTRHPAIAPLMPATAIRVGRRSRLVQDHQRPGGVRGALPCGRRQVEHRLASVAEAHVAGDAQRDEHGPANGNNSQIRFDHRLHLSYRPIYAKRTIMPTTCGFDLVPWRFGIIVVGGGRGGERGGVGWVVAGGSKGVPRRGAR